MKAWTATGMPAPDSTRASIAMWRWCECTPPGDISPMTCAVPPEAFIRVMNSKSASFEKNVPSSIALLIRGRSIQTIRPAPIFVCPTSELPIWPAGRPTSSPEAASCACGSFAQMRSKFGVSASAGALFSRSARRPQPSRMQRTTGFRGIGGSPGCSIPGV